MLDISEVNQIEARRKANLKEIYTRIYEQFERKIRGVIETGREKQVFSQGSHHGDWVSAIRSRTRVHMARATAHERRISGPARFGNRHLRHVGEEEEET